MAKFTNLAKQDLINIRSFTTHKWSARQAKIYLDLIRTSVAAIDANPAAGLERLLAGQRFQLVYVGSHVVFYAVDTEGVVIVLRVLHKSMNWPQLLKSAP